MNMNQLGSDKDGSADEDEDQAKRSSSWVVIILSQQKTTIITTKWMNTTTHRSITAAHQVSNYSSNPNSPHQIQDQTQNQSHDLSTQQQEY